MDRRAKKIWIGFFIAVVIGVFVLHQRTEMTLIKASKNVERGNEIRRNYFDGNIGFFEFYEQIQSAKLLPAHDLRPAGLQSPTQPTLRAQPAANDNQQSQPANQ